MTDSASQAPAAAAPASPPPSAPWYGAPELEAVVTEKGWSGTADVIKAYQAMAADQSGLFAPPPADADAATWAAAMRKLGAPEKPEDYGLARPEDLPEDFPFDEGRMTAFAAKAAELGVLPHVARELLKWDLEQGQRAVADLRDAEAKAQKENETKVKVAWGSKHAANMAAVDMLLRKYGGDAGALTKLLPGTFPDLTLVLGKIAAAHAEDTAVTSRPGSTPGGVDWGKMYPKSADALQKAGKL